MERRLAKISEDCQAGGRAYLNAKGAKEYAKARKEKFSSASFAKAFASFVFDLKSPI